MAISREKVSKNIIWRMAESASTQIISYVVALVLARKLGPDVYGNFALAGRIINFMLLFIDVGFSTVLIQRQEVTDTDYSSVFIFNISSGAFLYLILFISAPFIASWYKIPELSGVLRGLGLKLIFSAFSNIQSVYITKHIAFKKFFFASLTGTLLSGVVGMYLVYAGCGIWSMVALSIVDISVDAVFLWIMTKWNPLHGFSFSSLWQMFKTGVFYVTGSFVCSISGVINSSVISIKYTSADLGYYDKGAILPERIFTTISSTIDSVLFPVMSEASTDCERLKSIERRTLKTSSFVILPALFGLAAVSPALIEFLLTDTWIKAVPYSMIFCITASLRVFQSANKNVLQSMGKAKELLKLELIYRACLLTSLAVTVWFGTVAIALGSMVSMLISQIVIAIPVGRLLHYYFYEQIKDILPHLLVSAAMAITVYFIGYIDLPCGIVLAIQVASGVILYFGAAFILKFESLKYCVDVVSQIIRKK